MSDNTVRRYQIAKCHLYAADGTYKQEATDVEVYLAAEMDALLGGMQRQFDDLCIQAKMDKAELAERNAELARLQGIAEEQRLREYKLVESLQAAKSELALVRGALEIAMREGGMARTELMLENRDLRAGLEQAKADFEKQKTMTRLEAKANYNAIDEIHLLEAQRDRAEAACAAYVQFIQSIRDAANIPYGTDPDRLLPKIYARCCNMSTAPYPGQRYLDLAKLVEGLPKYTGMVWVMTDLEYGEEVEQQLTTALAALLAWRKSTPPPREQGDSK